MFAYYSHERGGRALRLITHIPIKSTLSIVFFTFKNHTENNTTIGKLTMSGILTNSDYINDEAGEYLYLPRQNPAAYVNFITERVKKSEVWEIASNDGLHTRKNLEQAIQMFEEILKTGGTFKTTDICGNTISTAMILLDGFRLTLTARSISPVSSLNLSRRLMSGARPGYGNIILSCSFGLLEK